MKIDFMMFEKVFVVVDVYTLDLAKMDFFSHFMPEKVDKMRFSSYFQQKKKKEEENTLKYSICQKIEKFYYFFFLCICCWWWECNSYYVDQQAKIVCGWDDSAWHINEWENICQASTISSNIPLNLESESVVCNVCGSNLMWESF